eukprot:CAMPEP_0119148044 /NCGR_PEP_ID=MMETSP1310-20130426/41261_1 /TAXON_ID=464262 /ORGANISM="Genus nov. species nov., Strain RCC2339" /LENGTH=31 /DNA_ID= /DNA_START= /DNA_END= /DNA_ORIENTATION=
MCGTITHTLSGIASSATFTFTRKTLLPRRRG